MVLVVGAVEHAVAVAVRVVEVGARRRLSVVRRLGRSYSASQRPRFMQPRGLVEVRQAVGVLVALGVVEDTVAVRCRVVVVAARRRTRRCSRSKSRMSKSATGARSPPRRLRVAQVGADVGERDGARSRGCRPRRGTPPACRSRPRRASGWRLPPPTRARRVLLAGRVAQPLERARLALGDRVLPEPVLLLSVSVSPSWSVSRVGLVERVRVRRFSGYGRYAFGFWCSSSLRSRADWYS